MARLLKIVPRTWRDKYRFAWYSAVETTPKLLAWHWTGITGRRKPPHLADGRMLVHLGCGGINDPRFVNVDKRPAPHIHHLSGVESLPFFSTSSADLLYVSHCLEHVAYDRVPVVLAEWCRVLKPGGKLRIAVPDFEGIVQAYELSGRSAALVQPTLMGGQNYALNFHYSIFDKNHLTQLLQDAGFTDVRIWHHDEDDLTQFDDCSKSCIKAGEKEVSVSLNLQGTKALETHRVSKEELPQP